MKLNDLKNLVTHLDLDASNINNVYDNLTADEYELLTGAYCPNNDYYGLVLPIIKGIEYNAQDLIKRGSNWFVVACNFNGSKADKKLKPVDLYIKMVEAVIGEEFFIDSDIEATVFNL